MKHDNPGAGFRVSAEHIADNLVKAIVEQRLTPGTRLGEEELSAVFGVSRTVVRQALTQLGSQGIVSVKPRKGWFVVEPSEDEVREVFAARRIIEGALVREFIQAASPAQMKGLRKHLHQQHCAVTGQDVARRTHLLADFHVQIPEMLGNRHMVRIIRDLTMRTNLVSMLYQSRQEASHSADEHDAILIAIESRNADRAAQLMAEHLRSVEAGLRQRKSRDPIQLLQETLSWNPDRLVKSG